MPSLKRLLFRLRGVGRILWVRVAVISVMSLIAALLAGVVDPLVPDAYKQRFNDETILPVLNILASGMLAVTTFSLGVMVSSHRSLAANTTPRIHRLLMEDTSTQMMLATFIGSFVFSLSAIILFRAGYYEGAAAVVVFVLTVLLVATIVVSLVRWISKLSHLGSMDYALERTEMTARETLETHRRSPTLGARPLDSMDDIPAGALPVAAPGSGFLRFVDVPALRRCATERDARIFVTASPGDRILAGETVAWVDGMDPEEAGTAGFTIGRQRSYDQDPRYALQALRETASRALSPGINDPGTAVEVVSRLEILLHDFFRSDPGGDEDAEDDKVRVIPLKPGDLIETAFRDIGRDGAGFVDVLAAVATALRSMGNVVPEGDPENRLRRLRKELEQHAEAALRTETERARFRDLARRDRAEERGANGSATEENRSA